VAARDVRFDDDRAMKFGTAGVRVYRDRMSEYAEMSPLQIWYDRIDLAKEMEGASERRSGSAASGSRIRRTDASPRTCSLSWSRPRADG
jgi:hypothetical protein